MNGFFVTYAIVLSLALAWKGVRAQAPGVAAGAAGEPHKVLVMGATGGTGRPPSSARRSCCRSISGNQLRDNAYVNQAPGISW